MAEKLDSAFIVFSTESDAAANEERSKSHNVYALTSSNGKMLDTLIRYKISP